MWLLSAGLPGIHPQHPSTCHMCHPLVAQVLPDHLLPDVLHAFAGPCLRRPMRSNMIGWRRGGGTPEIPCLQGGPHDSDAFAAACLFARSAALLLLACANQTATWFNHLPGPSIVSTGHLFPKAGLDALLQNLRIPRVTLLTQLPWVLDFSFAACCGQGVPLA